MNQKLANVTQMSQPSNKRKQQLLVVTNGKVVSQPLEDKTVVDGSLEVHDAIPHSEGFYKLETNGSLALAEVVEQYGVFVCRLLDGSRCTSLAPGQLLHGPFDLATTTFEEHKVEISTLLPSADNEKEELELELDDAYAKISALEKEMSLQSSSQVESKLRNDLISLKSSKTSLEEKLANYSQTINVQNEELSEVNKTVLTLQRQVDKLTEKLSLANKQMMDATSLAGSTGSLSSEQQRELLDFVVLLKTSCLGNAGALKYLSGLEKILK